MWKYSEVCGGWGLLKVMCMVGLLLISSLVIVLGDILLFRLVCVFFFCGVFYSGEFSCGISVKVNRVSGSEVISSIRLGSNWCGRFIGCCVGFSVCSVVNIGSRLIVMFMVISRFWLNSRVVINVK